MPDLRLVPPAEPEDKQAVFERIKAMKRAPGLIQCNRCGSRSIMTVVNGSWIDKDGKYHRGAVCEDRVCYDCHRKGIWSPMLPDPPKLVKEPKPRRTKPKAVK
jgi:hypothetical protein